ncbi:Uncharacterized protein APZ42_025262 [Daphnia magna]|uniref:Uncharacterized protein n=1 Tax=Daphnia magna TaxID=35525 RepID=A0A162DDK2_9CRUS|nr:Uncharacterized protein APZ42_025262 [Daphnia magna]
MVKCGSVPPWTNCGLTRAGWPPKLRSRPQFTRTIKFPIRVFVQNNLLCEFKLKLFD